MANGLLLTTSWDDGHPMDSRIAELLTKYELRGTFYVPMTAERSVMSPGQIRELSARFEVGAHTLHHIPLAAVADAVAKEEIAGAKAWVEQVTGKPCTVFCFPRGRYHRRHLSMVRQAGYQGVRTVEVMSLASPRQVEGLAVVPTTVQAHPHRPLAYVRNMVKRFALRNLADYLFWGRSSDWLGACEMMLALGVRRGGVFHLWGHSWEIEALDLWQPLEQALRLMGEYRRHGTPVTNAELCRIVAPTLAFNRGSA